MKDHRINPHDKKGRNSCIGVLNKLPKIKPIQATVTPIEMEIQNGPRLDLLYLCLISEKARYTGKLMFLKPSRTSFTPLDFFNNITQFN